MKPYQERYIENLKLVMSLSDFSADTPGDIPLFIEERKRKNGQIRQIIAENTESLRRNLMPLLDNIVSAPEDEIRIEIPLGRNGRRSGSWRISPRI